MKLKHFYSRLSYKVHGIVLAKARLISIFLNSLDESLLEMTTHVISYISQVCYCWNLYHLYPPVQMYTGTARKSEPEGLRGI